MVRCWHVVGTATTGNDSKRHEGLARQVLLHPREQHRLRSAGLEFGIHGQTVLSCGQPVNARTTLKSGARQSVHSPALNLLNAYQFADTRAPCAACFSTAATTSSMPPFTPFSPSTVGFSDSLSFSKAGTSPYFTAPGTNIGFH
jgi:hypothetical protein